MNLKSLTIGGLTIGGFTLATGVYFGVDAIASDYTQISLAPVLPIDFYYEDAESTQYVYLGDGNWTAPDFDVTVDGEVHFAP